MKYKNLTPHAITLNDGRVFESEGIARVSAVFSDIENDCCTQSFGEVVGLPDRPQGRCCASYWASPVRAQRKGTDSVCSLLHQKVELCELFFASSCCETP